jgi:nucleoid-associated protein
MTLKHSIIHKIARPVPDSPLTTQARETENSCTGPIASLFEQLKRNYLGRSQKQYGHFDSEQGDNPLPGWLKDLQLGKSTFASFSKRLLDHLQNALGEYEDGFEAHLLLALERVLEQDRFYIFWITHAEAQHIANNLEVETARFIDSAKLQYAARINLDEWQEEDSQKYFSLLTAKGNKALGEAFTRFCGFSEGLDLVEDTREFLDIVDQYAQALPAESVREYKTRVLDYCMEQDRHGEPVVIKELSNQLNETAPEEFASFVSDKQQQPKAELHTDRSSLKRYIRFFGRDKNISISFSSDIFGEDIQYDELSDTLTIKKIPKSLKDQLKKAGQ